MSTHHILQALVNAEAGSRFHESTATCTLELMLAEAESTRPGKLKLTAESEQVQCGGSFGLTITVRCPHSQRALLISTTLTHPSTRHAGFRF